MTAETETPIEFWRTSDEFGVFSNFARYPITVDGLVYPTSEHYYQAMKFEGTPRAEQIRLAKSAREAADLGRDPTATMRADWDTPMAGTEDFLVKDMYMLIALTCKFTQHAALEQVLLSTKGRTIVEASPKDSYWGDGPDKKGKNKLGVLLMRLRDELSKDKFSTVLAVD